MLSKQERVIYVVVKITGKFSIQIPLMSTNSSYRTVDEEHGRNAMFLKTKF